jgi:metal-sulfur cluster biosynthetic enzyme
MTLTTPTTSTTSGWMMTLEAGGRVNEKLKRVFDPEISINEVDHGLIYACDAHQMATGVSASRSRC